MARPRQTLVGDRLDWRAFCLLSLALLLSDDGAVEARALILVEHSLECLGQDDGTWPRVIALLPPKTASRHLVTLLQEEYGERGPRSCKVVEIHSHALQLKSDDCTHEIRRRWLQRNDSYTQQWLKLEQVSDKLIPGRTVAMVRDPVEQLLSLFSFTVDAWQKMPAPKWQRELELLAASPLAQNSQLALLTGLSQSAASVVPKDCEIELPAAPTEEEFQRFKKRVEDGHVILGDADRFEESVRLIARKLGFKNVTLDGYDFSPRRADRLERTTHRRPGDRTHNRLKRKQVPERILQQIRDATMLDRKLYELASSRLDMVKDEL